MEKMISMLDALCEIVIQISKMPACTEELKHIANVIEQTRREMAMQVDEDGSRFASSDSCQHVKAGHAK